MNTRAVLVLVVAVVLIAGVATGLYASPLGQAQETEPTPTPAPAPTATATSKDPVTVWIATGADPNPCRFTVRPPGPGWTLLYGFGAPSIGGTLTDLDTGDAIEMRPASSAERTATLQLEAGVTRRFEIKADGGPWQYSVQPPEGTRTATNAASPNVDPRGFRLRFCRG